MSKLQRSPLTDYFSAKRIMALASIITGVACILFVESTSILPALLSRFIMGFCGAFAFVGTLRIASTYFSIRTFSILTGITQAMGMMGAAFGQGPLRYYIDNLGPRLTMVSFSLLFFIISIGFFFVKLPMNTNDMKTKHDFKALRNFKSILKIKPLWVNCIYIGCLYGPTTVFAEMWGVNYTESFRSLSHTQSAFIVSLIFIGMIVGCSLFGLVGLRVKNVTLMRLSAFFSLMVMIVIIYIPRINISLLPLMFFIYGVSNAGIIPAYTRAAKIVNSHMSGLALGITNMFSILIGSIMIQIVGLFLSFFDHKGLPISMSSANSYQLVFLMLIICFFIALLISIRIKE
ncbi:MAG: MFS transporter [Gammaproteobacteria bacterium]|nr:MAG: MFS transporter [Gammaproteobacteria bacterium]